MSLFSRFSVMARVLGMVSLQSMRAAEAGVALRAPDLPRVSAGSSEQVGYLGSWHLHPGTQGRPGLIDVNLKDKEGQTGKFRLGSPERSSVVQDGGLLHEVLGPSKWRELPESLPSYEGGDHSQIKGSFCSGRVASVENGESLPQARGLMSGRRGWGRPFSPEDRFPDL